MQISFNPPLGQTTHAVVLPEARAAQLIFTATFTSASAFEEFKRDGLRAELWSNIPIAGRQPGEWGERVFRDGSGDLSQSAESTDTRISLGSSGGDTNQGAARLNTLFLEFDIPLSDLTEFAYTYRLVYPSGEIRWLGQFGCDGRLAFAKGDSRIHFSEGWTVEPNGAYLWQSIGPSDRTEVAQLRDGFEFDIRTIGTENGSLEGELERSSLCIIVPRINLASIVRPQAFALAASDGSSISIDGRRIKFTASDSGSLVLQNYIPGSDSNVFIEGLLSHNSSSRLRSTNCPTPGHIILATPENTNPVSVFVIPLVSTLLRESEVLVSAKNLTDLMPGARRLSIFSSANKTWQTFCVPHESKEERSILFYIQGSVGRFILSEVFMLGNEMGAWQVSIVSRYTAAASATEPADKLPTPPPSPLLLPVVPPGGTRASSPAVPNLPEVGTSRDVFAARSLSGALRPNTQTGLRGYMTIVFMIATMLLRTLLVQMLENFRIRRTISRNDRAPFLSRSRPSTPEKVNSADLNAPDPATKTTDFSSGLPLIKVVPKTLSEVPESLLIDIPAGSVSVLLRRLTGDVTFGGVRIELDGKEAQYSTKDIGENTFWVDIRASEEGGRVKITANF
jgi:hypothetical protein